MKKSFFVFFSALMLPLFAAVDGSKSFFRVSTHQPGVNTPVVLQIFVRNAKNQPCDAKLNSKPAAKITKVKKGEYRCEMVFKKAGEKITPQIFAGKVAIRENLLPDKPLTGFASSYTSRGNLVELAHEKGRLRIINLATVPANASWGFGRIDKDKLLQDRRYRGSGIIETSDVLKGRGAAFYFSSRNAKGRYLPGSYSVFVRNKKVNVTRIFALRGGAVNAMFGFSMHNSDGKGYVSNARMEVIPTFIVQEKPGITVEVTSGKKNQRIARTYSGALVPFKKQLDNVLARVRQSNINEKSIAIPGRINAVSALKLRNTILQKIKEIEKKESEAQKKLLEQGFIPSPLKLLAPRVRATIATRGRKPAVYYKDKFYIPPHSKNCKLVRPSFGCAFDNRNFYVDVIVPGKPNIQKGTGKHDDTTLWRYFGDKIELFVNKPGTRGYFQFAAGPGGQKYDEADGDAFVNLKWDVKIKFEKDDTRYFFTIPWKEMDIDPAREKELRMNLIISKNSGDSSDHKKIIKQTHIWSFANRGYREYDSMGFVVLGKLPAGVKDYIAWKNNEIKKEHQAANRAAADAAKKMRSSRKTAAISFNWNEDQSYEKDPAFQIRLISKYMAKPAPAKLSFRIAGNEFAHRAFAVAAIKNDLNAAIELTDLKSKDGKKISKENLSIVRTLFLEPRPDIHPRLNWSKRPLPELYEKVEGKTLIKCFSVAQFRLYIDSRKCAPGKYSGSFKIGGITVPVSCEIMDFALPACETQPVPCNIFSTLAWGGKTGEAWAKFYQEYYVSDVSMEHPRIYVDDLHVNCERDCRCSRRRLSAVLPDLKNGRYKGLPWRWDGYSKAVVEYRTPAGAKVRIDGKRYDFDDRIRICAKWNLRVVLSNRNGFMFVDHMEHLAKHLEKQGLPRKNFIYKLGDEDPGPYFLPVAKEIRKRAPGINITMIPSGPKYWDLKPLMEGFTQLEYSSAAFTVDEQGRKDLQYMRSKGFPIRRYTNRTSWAERSPVLSGRRDLWEVVIGDKLDGMTVWTAAPRAPEKYSIAYGCNRALDWPSIPPENQHLTQLVYWRKQGDLVKPIASLRLEELRDGVTDSLYYREAHKRLTAAKDQDGLKKLQQIVKMPKLKFSDYEKARAAMRDLILKHK